MNFIITTALCWAVVFTIWIGGMIFNAWKGPKVLRKGSKSWQRPYWVLAPIIFFIFLSLRHLAWHRLTRGFWVTNPGLRTIGLILVMGGAAFAIWARFTLGKMWSSSVTVKSEHRLHTEGPYRITRHPIYTGFLSMLAGSVLTIGLWFLPGLLMGLIGFPLKIREEEKLMIDRFGEQYLEYKRQVPQLIPGLRHQRSNRPVKK